MLRPRIIPCLLVQNGGLVKTVKFENPKYVGDPINAVRIFNEKEVDELIVVDIDATPLGREPNYKLIANLAAECNMPLCYAGGVRTPAQVERIISLGVEKVAIGAAAVATPDLISRSAQRVGSQSVVVVLDVKKVGLLLRRHEVFTERGNQPSGLDPVEFARQAQHLGAGELLVNSIDNDGMMKGYDVELVGRILDSVDIPVSILGGAGSLFDIRDVVRRHGAVGLAAGSLFVFKGKYRAVLIQYPTRVEKDTIAATMGS